MEATDESERRPVLKGAHVPRRNREGVLRLSLFIIAGRQLVRRARPRPESHRQESHRCNCLLCLTLPPLLPHLSLNLLHSRFPELWSVAYVCAE